MRYTEVVYSRTKNLGSYESEKVELRCVIEEEDNADEVIFQVKSKAMESLGLLVSDPVNHTVRDQEEKKEEPTVKEEKKTAKNATKKTTKKTPKKTPKKLEVAEEEVAEEEVEEEEEKVETPPATLEEVKTLLKVVWKNRGKSVAMDILRDIGGVEKTDELSSENFDAVIEECRKCLLK